jgi:CheY-like chemotaxis protein
MNLIVVCDTESINEFKFGLSKFDQSKVSYITSKEQWVRFNTGSQNNPNALVLVLAELTWEPAKRLSDFQGMEIIRWMRMEQRWLNPVIICSFIKKDLLVATSNPHAKLFSILRVQSSHQFQELPFMTSWHGPEKSLVPLRSLQLYDVVDHFYKQKGILDEIIHRLKDRIITNYGAAIDEATKALELIISPDNIEDLTIIMTKLRKDAKNSDLDFKMNLVRKAKDKLMELIPAAVDANEHLVNDVNWLTLCIDDNESIRSFLSEQFTKRKLPHICVGSAEEAFDCLDKDAKGELERPLNEIIKTLEYYPANRINVVVTDLRFEDQNQNWHPYQGYDIIEELHKNNENTLAFFMLTSKTGSIRHEYSKIGAKIDWFFKDEVIKRDESSNLNEFVKKIERAGNEVNEARTSTLKSSAWTGKGQKNDYPLQDYYWYHRNSANYTQKEIDINAKAKDMIDAINNQISSSSKNKKPVECPYKFYAKLKNKPSDPIEMDKFYERLIGRRIVLSLQVRGLSTDEIVESLKDITDEEAESKNANNNRQIFSSCFALSTRLQNNIPDQILPEERLFLEREMGYSISNSVRSFFPHLRKQLTDFLKSTEKNLKSNQDSLSKIGVIQKEIEKIGTTYKANQTFQSIIDLIDSMPRNFIQREVKNEFKTRLENLVSNKNLTIPKDLDLQVFILQLSE